MGDVVRWEKRSNVPARSCEKEVLTGVTVALFCGLGEEIVDNARGSTRALGAYEVKIVSREVLLRGRS